jgi:hypothetical protein
MTAAMSRVQSYSELTKFLLEALKSETPEFFDALYAIETIKKPALRPLVATMRDDSMRFFRMAREKLAPQTIEVKSASQQGSSWVVEFVLDQRSILEITVDDIYERDGTLHTRDVIRLDLR